MNLYITADLVGLPTGGGAVTYHESLALTELGDCLIWDREQLLPFAKGEDPWCWDEAALLKLQYSDITPEHVHLYAGTFTKTVLTIKDRWPECKVTYTAAAHNIETSKIAHTLAGWAFHYPHLTDPVQWEDYVEGYRKADVVICPSTHSAECMYSYGCMRIQIIPHGCEIPSTLEAKKELGFSNFVVGYLGAYGPDKGVATLIEAWRLLNYKNSECLLLGGRDSTSPYFQSQLRSLLGNEITFQQNVDGKTLRVLIPNCGIIYLGGWFDSVSDFYREIDLYVQPSLTEGFGIEVLEAMAHGKPVLCSRGAGAVDLIKESSRFVPNDPRALADHIERDRLYLKQYGGKDWGQFNRELAMALSWEKVRKLYGDFWRSL